MVDCPNFAREKLHKLREQDAERIKETLGKRDGFFVDFFNVTTQFSRVIFVG